MKKKFQITVYVTLEVDMDDEVVKEYDDIQELVSDVVSYRFSPALPVIKNGAVNVDEIFHGDIEKEEDEEE